MNQRDTKFVSRIIVLSMTSLVFSIGVRIVLENEQLTKLIPRSVAREFLLVFAPLVSLMVIHYTLAVKSFGMRSIQTEGLVYFFCASIFLTITLAYFLGRVSYCLLRTVHGGKFEVVTARYNGRQVIFGAHRLHFLDSLHYSWR